MNEFEPEEFLGQVWNKNTETWQDYARGTEEQAKAWQAKNPRNRRIVDWIYKERIIVDATD